MLWYDVAGDAVVVAVVAVVGDKVVMAFSGCWEEEKCVFLRGWPRRGPRRFLGLGERVFPLVKIS